MSRRRDYRSLLLLLTALLGGCDASAEFSIGGKSLDPEDMEKTISAGLGDQANLPDPEVDCAGVEDIDVEEGGTFVCTGTAPNGDRFPIDVTLTDDRRRLPLRGAAGQQLGLRLGHRHLARRCSTYSVDHADARPRCPFAREGVWRRRFHAKPPLPAVRGFGPAGHSNHGRLPEIGPVSVVSVADATQSTDGSAGERAFR